MSKNTKSKNVKKVENKVEKENVLEVSQTETKTATKTKQDKKIINLQNNIKKNVNKNNNEIFEATILDVLDEALLEIKKEKENFSSVLKQNKNVKKYKSPRILTKEELGIEKKKKKNKKSKKQKEEIAVERFKVDVKKGLTKEQVALRQQQGLTNKKENKNVKTYKSIFFSNICTFFNLLCFLVAGALISVQAYSNLVFLLIIVANILIGIIQEIKAKKTVEKISLVTAPTALAIRDGIRQDVNVNDVVLDDILYFSLGKQICTDCIVDEGEAEVNESLLTGESHAIKKKKGDILYSGSFISSGKCFAKVEKVGDQNYSSQLASKAKEYKKPKSELLNSLRLIIKCIGIVIIPLAIAMYYNIINQPDATIPETVKKTAGLIVGMIPAGMFLLTSMALAVGVIKLARKRTLVQDLYSIEMLARTDVLCLDKTGTITDGTMKVNSVIQIESNVKHTTNEIIGSMLTALDDNNQTSRALATHFGYSKELVAESILPFSSSRKLSAVTFKNGETFVMGAPEFVLKGKNPEVDKIVKQYAQKGFRVLLVASCDGKIENDKLPISRKPIFIIIIEDHVREDAPETIKWFKDNGVQIKIISGDNPITVSEVSKRVGVEKAENYISLEGLTEQQVIEAAEKYTVFGRVSPEQKSILVKALKSKGHKVAMTGDGVNDILALKEADCSIAMASGSEATRNVSHLVLLDSNFSSMPSVVAEGRRVVNNIQKSSSLFLMKTIFAIMLSIFCLIVNESYPFNTNQMLLLEYFVIGLPSFFLAMQPNTQKIQGRFLPNLISKALPGAIIFLISVIGCYVFNLLTAPDIAQFQTMSSIVVTCAGLLILYNLCKPYDLFRGILVLTMILLVILALTLIPFSFFEYANLTLSNWLFIAVIVQFASPLYATTVKICDKIRFS